MWKLENVCVIIESNLLWWGLGNLVWNFVYCLVIHLQIRILQVVLFTFSMIVCGQM